MTVAVSRDAAVTTASYEICYILGKHMKPFTDAEIVKECFISASSLLFDNLAFDSSTDISGTSQCSIFVRYCTDQNSINEDLLKFIPMKGQTRGIDYLNVITNFLDNNDIDIKKLLCVCTDGCPSMTGCDKGFISLLKKQYNLTNILSFHIIHQENLTALVSIPEVDLVMKSVIKIVNYIRANELNHRIFKSLLEEMNSDYSDVLLHTSVRWLSRGKVLQRFFNLRLEIIAFLQQNNKFDEIDKNNNWWCLLAYMCDITEKLNKLNRGLQGENKIISQMANKVFAFEEKLEIYYKEIQNQILHNFPTLTKAKQDDIIISQTNNIIILNHLATLSNEFKRRFQDLRGVKNCFLLLENPWHLEVTSITQLAALIVSDYSKVFDEFIELKNDTNLEVIFKEKREQKEYFEFWNLVPGKYKTIQKCAHFLLTMFTSTFFAKLHIQK
ncbi:hypothetical protein QTP88_021127 [Uroleucon formosanum]